MQLRVLILGVILSVNVFGGRVERYNESSKIFTPKTCQKCEIKQFKIQSYDYKAIFSDSFSLGTAMYASFKTDKVENLKKYGVVQLIKGCHFESKVENGVVVKRFSRAREFFGEIIKYKHPEWVIDSIDLDPVYASYNDHRHWSYRWNEVFDSIAQESSRLFRDSKPTHPILYVSDYPGTAFEFAPNEAMNISLKFKTCLYNLDDVPTNAKPSEYNLDKAIACHDWDSSFIFNHNSQKYEKKTEIDPFCLE